MLPIMFDMVSPPTRNSRMNFEMSLQNDMRCDVADCGNILSHSAAVT